MNRLLIFMAALSWAACPAVAEQYWIAYEGDDFPENVGWDRHWGVHVPPGDPNSVPDRSIEDGMFVLDTTCDIWLYDYYEIDRAIDPDAGELFVAEWRIAVDEFAGLYDAAIVIARDSPPGHVSLYFRPGSVVIRTEDLEFEIGEGFHDFRFESEDMEQFNLYVGGALLHTGVFESESLLQSYVAFGNGTAGSSSLSRWDYFRFGVVPEPHTAVLLLVASLLWRSHRAVSGAPRTVRGGTRHV